jgi:hypothetical protein
MGTEESIFTIMTYLDPEVFEIEMIEDNGLLGTFFENVKTEKTKLSNQTNKVKRIHENNDTIFNLESIFVHANARNMVKYKPNL